MTAADDHEVTPAQVITRDWMKYLGYEPEQIAEAEARHHEPKCEWTGEYWQCYDEIGDSRHPVRDEMDDVAALVMFVAMHQSNLDAVTAVATSAKAAGYRKAVDELPAHVEAVRFAIGDVRFDNCSTEQALHVVAALVHAMAQDAPSARQEPPPAAEPRVWALPVVPDDVRAVDDRDGIEWRRRADPTVWQPYRGHGPVYVELDLLRLRGPLTEVRDA